MLWHIPQSWKSLRNSACRTLLLSFLIRTKLPAREFMQPTHKKTQAGAPDKRLSKLLPLTGRQKVRPRGEGEDMRLFGPTGRKTGEKNWNRKNSALLFSLRRDNKQSDSTAYGGVQAGRCSKRPLHSLPYGVTNCCFFTATGRYTKRDVGKGENTNSELGQKFDCFDVAFCGSLPNRA